MANDIDGVEAIQAEYGAAVTAGDPDRWSLIFEENAAYYGPDLPVLHGRSAIKQWASDNFFGLYSEMKNSSDHEALEVADSWAAGSGPFRFSGVMNDGTAVPEINGKFMAIYRKQSDNSWLISRLIFNWDAPMAG